MLCQAGACFVMGELGGAVGRMRGRSREGARLGGAWRQAGGLDRVGGTWNGVASGRALAAGGGGSTRARSDNYGGA